MSDYKREKIFVTLRKFDAEWSKNPDKTFCEIFKQLTNIEFIGLTDEELAEKLRSIDIK